jgi:hypothetical protein
VARAATRAPPAAAVSISFFMDYLLVVVFQIQGLASPTLSITTETA